MSDAIREAPLLREITLGQIEASAPSAVDEVTRVTARSIVDSVRAGGEPVLREYSIGLDGLPPSAPLVLDRAALERAAAGLGRVPAQGWRHGAMPWALIRAGGKGIEGSLRAFAAGFAAAETGAAPAATATPPSAVRMPRRRAGGRGRARRPGTRRAPVPRAIS